MFCRKCGKEVSDEAVVCVHCGCMINENTNISKTHSKEMNTSKTGIGILLALFLQLLGLVIGLVMYPEDTVARKTFLKAWIITECVIVGIGILAYVIFIIIAIVATSAV